MLIETNAENGQIIKGQLQGITVDVEDMFLKAIVPSEIPEDEIPRYNFDLFPTLWEARGSSSNTGRETFQLKGGKGIAAISGTQSVKLLDVPATSLIQVTERYLARIVAGVSGEPLIDAVWEGGIIQNVIGNMLPLLVLQLLIMIQVHSVLLTMTKSMKRWLLAIARKETWDVFLS